MPQKRVLWGRRRFLRETGLAAGLTLAAPTILRAQTVALRMSSWLPPSSLIPENLLVAWADGVAQVTEGRVTVEIQFPPLGPPPAHLGLLQSGETDVAYSLHGYSGDEAFERAKIGQFSFLGDAFGASHAFSKVYGKLLKAEQEHENIHLLGLFQHGPGVLMLKDKVIRSPDDLKGLRLRTSGGYISGMLQEFGVESVPMPPTKVREALEAGTIDGVAFPYEAGPAFNIVDQISFVSEVPGGYYNASWFLAMSEQAKQRMAPSDFDLVEKHSSQVVHVLAAKAFDYADFLGKETMKAQGIAIEPANPELLSEIEVKAASYEERWAAQIAEDGYDGEKALSYTRRLTGER